MSRRRVVVTGIGMISPLGGSAAENWSAMLAGRSAVAPVPASWRRYAETTSTIWAPLPALDWPALGIGRIEQMQLDTSGMLTIAASAEAIQDAAIGTSSVDPKKNTFRLEAQSPERCGVFMGTGVGGITSFVGNLANHVMSPLVSVVPDPAVLPPMPPRFNPYAVPSMMPNAISALLGIRWSLCGPNLTFSQACAAGTVAVGHAFRAIAAGDVDLALCGGAEYLGDPYGGIFRGFDVARTLAAEGADLTRANRPFDHDRTGFLFAEGGAAVLVCEEAEAARRRGARVYAEIAGYAENFDGYSVMMMDPSAARITAMVEAAVQDAGCTPADLDYVNAHGTGTAVNDEIESSVIDRLFGTKPLVNATKSLTGHCIGASGGIEAAVTALSLFHQATHACHNLEQPIRDLRFVRAAGPCQIDTAITQSFAFGGHNAAVVMKRAGD
jgi:3-oxoacyl-[acyl-carrier-protein] synthase II